MRRVLLICSALAIGLLAAAPSHAAPATSQFVALLDLDNNPSTGCTVATANGPFTGVEEKLVTTVDLTQSPPQVISVTKQACTNPGTGTFGAPTAVNSPFAPPWAVGVGNGTGGADVVETYLPFTGLSVGATIRLGFTAQVVGGTGVADATLTTNGQQSGGPILLSAQPIAAVPTLSAAGLVLLGMVLAGCALVLLRRRRGPGSSGGGPGSDGGRFVTAGLLLLVLGLGMSAAGVALGGSFVPDGSVAQWNGIPPIATDPVGDAPLNADMVALFGAIQNDILFLRFDARIVGLPAVTSTTPANGATNVAGTSTVTVNFNEPVNVTASTFSLECPSGTPQAFTVSPAPPGNASTFTLTPAAALPAGVTCAVTVTAAQVSDDEGLQPAADYTFSFTTDGPPSVTATTPANGATQVGLSAPITITFSKAVNVTASAFTLQCPTGTPEPFSVSPAPPGGATTFTLTPSAALPAGTACTVTVVASQVKDTTEATPMSADYTFTYTTDTAPTVTSTTPADGATTVALNATVTINFSKAVNVSASAFSLACPTGTPVAFTAAPAPPGGATAFTLTPSANLPAGTTCTVQVTASQVSDVAAGTPLGANYVFSFTTDVAPTVTSTTPTNGATNQATNTTIAITFSTTVTVTASAFTVQCPVGTPETFTVSPPPPPAGGATTFTLTPSANLPASTTCTVTVVANQVADTAAGTNMAANYVFTFGVGNPPAVSSTTPANGATAVLATAPITITFTKAVNATGTAFTLQCPTGTPEAFTTSPTTPPPATTFTLTPTAALPAGAVCTVTAVAAQITDPVTSLHPTADYTFSFTVDTPPSVTSTTPANGATNVAGNATVTFTFNKAVNVSGTAFTLQCPSGTPIAFTLSPAPPGNATAFTLTPSATLPAGTTCVATAVANQIADQSGTNMTANSVVSFSTDAAPTVTSTTPANAATSVSLTSTVSFTFSKAVTVTATAFTLQCPSGTPVAFTLAPAPPGNATTFTLTPSAPLPASTACVATAVASQIKDAIGTPLAANVTVNFTTDTPPAVSSTTPANGATNVLPSATVSFTFTKAVNVTGTAFTLQCPSGTPVAFTLAPAPPGNATTFTLTPSASLPVSTTCVATAVASQITDAAGTNPTANDTISFTVANPPTVTSTTPANGATAVLATAPISITFSQAVNVTGTAFTLQCPTGTPEAFTLSPAPPGNATTFTLTPSAALPAGTVCTVTAVASQITSAASGVNLQANYVFSFTIDTPPTVTSTTPANGATNVAGNSTVAFTFSKAVNVTASAFTLQCPTGTPIAFTLSPAPPGGATTFTLTPSANLPAGTTCVATAVANQIADLAGTNMTANVTVSFSTDAAPTVTSTTPANGATSVALNSTVSFTFSKAVNVTATAFTLACPTGTPVAFTLAPAPPGNATTFTLTPSANLPASTTCVATAVASQITDAVGTHLAANDTVSFTTDTPPAVSSTTPANGATNVLPSATVSFTFTKAVNVTGTAFTLQCPSGTPVAFTLAPAPPGNATTFTLTPSASLPVSTTCVATAVASQITDAAGTNPTANDTISFTVANPPTVTSTTPANGATAVLATSPISITFSQAVNVTGTAFTLQCPTGTPEAFTLSPAPPGGVTTFTLTPSAALPAGTVCTVTAVASQITSVSAGVNLQSNYVFSFTTDTPPTVTSTTPANGATSVPLTSTVNFTFSKAVNVTGTAFTLACPTGTPVAFTLSPAPPGGATSFTLTPSANLPAGTTCVATAVASQITDLAGTHLAANVTDSFTTDAAPTVTTVTPANGATSVLASTTLTINFSKAVDVTGTAFTLACPTGTPESFTIAPAPPGGASTFTLTPSANLPAGAVCTATVVASQVTDVSAGTAMAANFTWSFTIDTPPTVTSTSPANGATSVSPATAVSVIFNKAVNVTASAFTLQCPTGTPESFTISPAPPGGATTFTLTPSANLPSDTVCTATVVASQVADIAGTQMAANYTWSFATPPKAVNDTYPETLIGNVSINSALHPFSVLTNDVFNTSVTITAFDATSANGGTVSMTTAGASAGQFTYNPPAGFIGTDTFTYTISDANGSSTATVSMPISGIIWFINDTASAGDGRLASPFNSLAAFQAINDGGVKHPAANANIFLYDSATGYTGPVTLLNGQKLIGQDATSSLTAITGLTPGVSSATLPSTGGGSPNKVSITSAANTVTLGSGNTVWGMTLGNATGTALIGASVGSLKLRDLTINTTGAAVNLANGALDAILNSVTSGGGTNGIALTTTTGSFDIEGGGASDPTNTTQGRTTAKNGGGTITLGSGGTIQNATGTGVLLSSATNVTLRNMVIQSNGGAGVDTDEDGIAATNGSSLLIDNTLIQNQAGNNGLHATGVAGLSLLHTQISNNATNASANASNDVLLDECTGTVTVNNSLFFNAQEDIFDVFNHTTTTVTVNASNDFIHNSVDGNGLLLEADDSSNVSLDFTGGTVDNCAIVGLEYLGNNTSGGGTVTVTGSHFDSNGGNNVGGADLNVAHQGAGKTVTFDIENNTTRQVLVPGSGTSISIDLGSTATSTTVLQGKILNNTVGKQSVTDSGSVQGAGIAIQANGAGVITALITGNVVRQVEEGMAILSSGTTDTLNATIENNDLETDTASVNSYLGLELTSGGAGNSDTICANVNGNVQFNAGATNGVAGVQAEPLGTSTIDLQGYTGAANNSASIISFLNGTATTVIPSSNFVGLGGTVKAAPSPCPTPP